MVEWEKGPFQVEIIEGYLNLESEDSDNDLFYMSSREKGHVDHLILQIEQEPYQTTVIKDTHLERTDLFF